VENKVKAKKQAERRLHQKVNAMKQRGEVDLKVKTKKNRSRGAIQREHKRQKRSAGEDDSDVIRVAHRTAQSNARNTEASKAEKRGAQKPVKPPSKQKRAISTEERQFDEMMHRHSSNLQPKASEGVSRKSATEKRWFE
jgi:hypothetical protein